MEHCLDKDHGILKDFLSDSADAVYLWIMFRNEKFRNEGLLLL